MDEQELTKDVGQRFKRFRKLVKRNRRGLAKDIRSTRSIVAKIEKGKIFPGIETLKILEEQYGLDTNWLVSGKGNVLQLRSPETAEQRKPYDELLQSMKTPWIMTAIFETLEKIKSKYKELIAELNLKGSKKK